MTQRTSSAPKFQYTGVEVSAKYLMVCFDQVIGTTRRARVVAVPWNVLAQDDVLAHLDRDIRRRMVEFWSGVAIESQDPLF